MNILPKTLHRVSLETEGALNDDATSANGSAILTTGQFFRALFGLLKRKKIFVIAFFVIISVGVGIYERYFNLTDAERAQKELKAAISAVSKHMILPEGDEPVLATVTDAEAIIKQQAFFTGAVNGDQLLLFPRNLKAVIFSPSRNKIINAGPIEQQLQAAANDQISNTKSQINSNDQNPNSQTSSAILTVEVRNGTGKTGYASTAAEQIRASDGYSIVKVTDAAGKDYKKTIVVARAAADAQKPMVYSLAAILGADVVSELPSGEKNTEADALIILGNQE